MNKGDIYYCLIKSYGNKINRPCVILEVLDDDRIKVLPITSVYSDKDTITSVDKHCFDCDNKPIFGNLNRTVKLVDVDCCVPPYNINKCSVTNKLKKELIERGFNF